MRVQRAAVVACSRFNESRSSAGIREVSAFSGFTALILADVKYSRQPQQLDCQIVSSVRTCQW